MADIWMDSTMSEVSLNILDSMIRETIPASPKGALEAGAYARCLSSEITPCLTFMSASGSNKAARNGDSETGASIRKAE